MWKDKLKGLLQDACNEVKEVYEDVKEDVKDVNIGEELKRVGEELKKVGQELKEEFVSEEKSDGAKQETPEAETESCREV